MIFLLFWTNEYRLYLSTSSDSDSDDIINNHDAMPSVDSTNISPSITKRRVNFIPKKNTNINGKSSKPTSPTSPPTTPLSPGTKMRRRRLRTTSRSGDDRISFRGRKPIYTAGNTRVIEFSLAIYSIEGRPAWYNATGEIKQAFVIGICGGSASGKTTVAQSIVENLNVPWVTLLSMDSFYKVITIG